METLGWGALLQITRKTSAAAQRRRRKEGKEKAMPCKAVWRSAHGGDKGFRERIGSVNSWGKTQTVNESLLRKEVERIKGKVRLL